MSGPITDAANAISNQSPAIKHFAQLVAAKLEPPAPVPVPPPPPQTDFTKVCKPGDDLDAFLASLKPGDRGGIEPGDYAHQPIGHSNGGTASAGILLGATDLANPPRLNGRLDLRGGFAYWTFDHLIFRDNDAPFTQWQVSWVIGGNHLTFRDCDFSNNGTKIGMEQINSSQYGVGSDNTFLRSWWHMIGRHPWGSTNNDHCFYDVGFRSHWVDCIFEDASDRGLQLRGPTGAHAEYVTAAGNGEGVIFGDIGARGCLVEKSILYDRKVKGRYLLEEYDPSGHDSGNRVDDCFVWNPDGSPGVGSLHSVTATNLHLIDPQLDPVTMLPKAGSPAAGYGCRVALPRYAV